MYIYICTIFVYKSYMYQNDKTFFFESRFFFAGKCKKLEKPCNNLLRTNYEGFVYLRVAFFFLPAKVIPP